MAWTLANLGEKGSEPETSRNFPAFPLESGREQTLWREELITFPERLRSPLTCLSAVEGTEDRRMGNMNVFIGLNLNG